MVALTRPVMTSISKMFIVPLIWLAGSMLFSLWQQRQEGRVCSVRTRSESQGGKYSFIKRCLYTYRHCTGCYIISKLSLTAITCLLYCRLLWKLCSSAVNPAARHGWLYIPQVVPAED